MSANDKRSVSPLKAYAEFLEKVFDDNFLVCRCLPRQVPPDSFQLLDGITVPTPESLDRKREKRDVLSGTGVKGGGHLPPVGNVQSNAKVGGASVHQIGLKGRNNGNV